MLLQDLGGLRDEPIDHVGTVLRLGLQRLDRERRHASSLRIRIAELGRQIRTTKDDHRAMHTLGLDEDLHAGNPNLAQEGNELPIRLRRDTPGAAIGHEPLLVDRREVDPRGQVGWLERKSDS